MFCLLLQSSVIGIQSKPSEYLVSIMWKQLKNKSIGKWILAQNLEIKNLMLRILQTRMGC